MPDSAYGGSWYADTMVKPPKHPVLRGETEADVCVVGGGLAGLTVAYELAKAKRRVVLLEAERVACKASGRNGGFVIPGFARDHEALIGYMRRRGGLPAARALWALSQAGLDYVRTIAQHMPEAHLTPGLLLVQRRDDLAAANRQAAVYRSLGSPAVVWDTSAVQAALGSVAYFQAVYLPEAFHIHPLNYALGLASLFIDEGGQIYEKSRAIDHELTGAVKSINTSEGTVHAKVVILAQGAEDKPLVKRAQPVAPFCSFIAVTEPSTTPLPSSAAFDPRYVPTYHRVVDGNRLLWGSRLIFFSSARVRRKIRKEIAKDYPLLSNVDFSHIWSGTMAYVFHRMPVIDQIIPNVWFLNGFGGHGLNTTAMAAQIVADAVVAHSTTWTLFGPFKRGFSFFGGFPGRIAAYLIYWVFRGLDRVFL